MSYERLTERNEFGEVYVSGKDEQDVRRKTMAMVERLATLEDMLESGLLVEQNNKPLTVEELKALEVGDWVLVISIRHDWEDYYKRIEPAFQYDNDKLIRFKGVYDIQNLYFEDYGKTWLAYKTK